MKTVNVLIALMAGKGVWVHPRNDDSTGPLVGVTKRWGLGAAWGSGIHGESLLLVGWNNQSLMIKLFHLD